MFTIKMLLRKLRRRFFNYGTIMKTFIKAERRLNKYRGEMLDEAQELGVMLTSLERVQEFTLAEADKAVIGLKKLQGLFSE